MCILGFFSLLAVMFQKVDAASLKNLRIFLVSSSDRLSHPLVVSLFTLIANKRGVLFFWMNVQMQSNPRRFY